MGKKAKAANEKLIGTVWLTFLVVLMAVGWVTWINTNNSLRGQVEMSQAVAETATV